METPRLLPIPITSAMVSFLKAFQVVLFSVLFFKLKYSQVVLNVDSVKNQHLRLIDLNLRYINFNAKIECLG